MDSSHFGLLHSDDEFGDGSHQTLGRAYESELADADVSEEDFEFTQGDYDLSEEAHFGFGSLFQFLCEFYVFGFESVSNSGSAPKHSSHAHPRQRENIDFLLYRMEIKPILPLLQPPRQGFLSLLIVHLLRILDP